EATSILIVDAEGSTREYLATVLSDQYRCQTAATAEKAMGLLTFNSFDLVITDVKLQSISGLALCHFIRKTRPGTAVILVSEKNGGWHKSVAEQLGALDFIMKPCDSMNLRKAVERALLRRTSEGKEKTGQSVQDV
ncbi:MAG TPA: response regulator, partial [Blastocatellia bacterium]